MDNLTPETLTPILSQLFQPDTTIVVQATAILKQHFKTVKAVENLLVLMSTAQDQNLRQISCVYLRKLIPRLWGNLTVDNQFTTKNLLLERFLNEPVTIVKKNIAEVIG